MTPVRKLKLRGDDPRAWGTQHGEELRDRIRALYEVRRELMLEKTDLGDEATLLALAGRHSPVLRDFDEDLYRELSGIAQGAGLTLGHLIVLNHYTDLRDLSRAHLDDGGCSVVFKQTSAGPLLGQTWDTHGSASEYVMLLEIPSRRGAPEGTVVFTTAGCVGMAGLSARGVAVAINNLNSIDARVGVVWPVLVRKLLRQRDAAAARDVVLGAPIGSGHHYSIADDHSFFGVETSGTRKKVTQQGSDRVHLHTNHCLDDEMMPTARVLSTSTTYARLDTLCALTSAGAPADAAELCGLLSQVSAPVNPRLPHEVATCGAVIFDVNARRVFASQGPPTTLAAMTSVAIPGEDAALHHGEDR